MSPYVPSAAPPPPGPTPGAVSVWSPSQRTRLETEWRKLRRAFAYHPFVEVVPLSGDPPAEYQVTYNVKTLVIDDAGQLAYVTSCPVHVWLPPQFPHNAPVVRPMIAVFHPNVAMEWIHLHPPWRPDANLIDVVTQVGLLLAFHSHDPNAVANPVAMNWVAGNPQLLPTDAVASFSPGAGGDPLTRLARFGPVTMRVLQEKLERAAERQAVPDGAPPPEELEQLTGEVDATLQPFVEPDTPEHVRTLAGELRELMASLLGDGTVWSKVGRQIALCNEVASAAGDVGRAEEALRRVLASEATAPPHHSKGLTPAEDGESGGGGVSTSVRLPPSSVVQPAALALRRAVRDGEAAVAELRAGLARLGEAPRAVPQPPGANSLLRRRYAREVSRLAVASEPAREAGAALASLEPLLHRARLESAAADRVAAWADHAELLRRGHDLAERLKATPPAQFQAYFTETAAGRSGPFEFEQRVELDDGTATPIAVWNLRAGVVRVVNSDTEEVIGRGDGRVALPSPAGPAGASAVTIVVGEHTDDLRAQLESLTTQAGDALSRLRAGEHQSSSGGPPATWLARVAAELDLPHEQQLAEERHRGNVETWRQLLADLATLGRYKQRLATCHLLTRLADFVPRVRADRSRQEALMARADARLAEIGARSGRDTETDRLIIPAQFAAEYEQTLADRDAAQQQTQRLQLALDRAMERLKLRIAKPRLYGSGSVPRPRILSPLPDTYVRAQPSHSDDSLQTMIEQLEAVLGTPLRRS